MVEGKVVNIDNLVGLVNGIIDMNVGLFCVYMIFYLKCYFFISKDLLLMVCILVFMENGLFV